MLTEHDAFRFSPPADLPADTGPSRLDYWTVREAMWRALVMVAYWLVMLGCLFVPDADAGFWDAGWTGLRIKVEDPEAAWRGDSACAPCNRLCRDLAGYTRGGTWRIGYSEFDGGLPNHVAIVRKADSEPGPLLESVFNGEVTGTVLGYRGDINAVIDLYPGKMAFTRRVASAPRPPAMLMANCPCGPNCNCPPDCPCRTQGGGYAPRATYTAARPLVYGTSWAAPAAGSPSVNYSYSRGVHLLGVPIAGTYARGSGSLSFGGCPGGYCP